VSRARKGKKKDVMSRSPGKKAALDCDGKEGCRLEERGEKKKKGGRSYHKSDGEKKKTVRSGPVKEQYRTISKSSKNERGEKKKGRSFFGARRKKKPAFVETLPDNIPKVGSNFHLHFGGKREKREEGAWLTMPVV